MSDPNKARARGRGQKPTPAPAAPGGALAKPAQQTPAGGTTVARARARAAPSTQAPKADPSRPGIASVTQQFSSVSLGDGASVSSSGSGDGNGTLGRGQLRGRRPIGEAGSDVSFIRTRPPNLNSKRAIDCNNKNIKPTQFIVNYFKVNKRPTWTLNLYRVDFNPPEDILIIKKALVKVHQDKLGAYVFDGTVLFSANTIVNKEIKLMSKKRDETPVEITIKHTRVLEFGDFQYLQLFNILMRNTLAKLNLQLVGRNFYDPIAKSTLPEYKLEVWPGYQTVMRQHEKDILLCVEIDHKVLRLQTVLEIWEQCNHNRDQFLKSVVAKVVMTRFNNCTYRIDDVEFDATPSSTFDMKGTQTSYIQYYKMKHNITLRDTRQPMLISKSKLRDIRAGKTELIYLPPELCYTTGLDDKMRSDFKVMKAFGDITRVDPKDRIAKIINFRRRIDQSEAKDIFKPWDLALENKPIEVQGHCLGAETICFGGNKIPGTVNADWTSAFRSNSLLSSKPLKKWVLFTTQQERQNAETFVQMIQKAGNGMQFTIERPIVITLANDRAQGYSSELERTLSSDSYSFAMCIVPNNAADRYASIKKKCSIDRAIPSQVIVKRNLTSKGAMSVATKVAIQINCKLGGVPWAVEIPLKGMMTIGFDVTHDSESKGSSYGALVASLDNNFGRYFSAVSPHATGNELSSDIGASVTKALYKYKLINEAFPRCLVVYRDGVGEGQIGFVVEHELATIQKVLSDIKVNTNQEISLTFVIVTKKIQTRIMLPNANPIPGSVIDDVITSPERYDFFLVSQSVRQGTVSPTYYNVIHDTNSFLNPDRLQRLTFKLCHLYFNWSGTVRVPAPCQYAHKLAFLCGQGASQSTCQSVGNLFTFLVNVWCIPY